jgi:uncharacterized Zn-finger protein
MNLNYHIHESSIKCPYCDEIYQDDDYAVTSEFETRVEVECSDCGKRFYAESCIVFNTYSDCKLNNTEHCWEKSTIDSLFNFKNCHETDIR